MHDHRANNLPEAATTLGGGENPSLPFYLIVENHHIMWISIEPRIHSLADAAYFLQRRCVQVRPSKIQHLWHKEWVAKPEEKGRKRNQVSANRNIPVSMLFKIIFKEEECGTVGPPDITGYKTSTIPWH